MAVTVTLKTLQQQTFKIRMEPHETVSAARAGAAGSEPRGGRAGLGLTPPPARDGPDLFPARGGARGGGGRSGSPWSGTPRGFCVPAVLFRVPAPSSGSGWSRVRSGGGGASPPARHI